MVSASTLAWHCGPETSRRQACGEMSTEATGGHYAAPLSPTKLEKDRWTRARGLSKRPEETESRKGCGHHELATH